ncbi:probable caffeoyl-CoA O-methyltransferase At4g26220 isoform X1 [Rosa rugosa]|uniref:probable caffeoyl-CoA O-methyltransferase At4g26220 isoform X1 n=1 Tax=Rosa rugosa TaxID=74645 RepID=UPI002B409F3A|nr:probable caffeoyl-CoA O-methyltransferase At4g26220 isoform X1 [Rosa rugosa]
MEQTAGSKKNLPNPVLLQDDEELHKNSCAVRAMENTRKRHPFTDKPLLQSEELYEYVMKTGVYPREPNPLKELRMATASHPMAYIGTAPDAGQLIAMLLKLANSKRSIEIGVFTGYSLLLTALTIPDDGKITAIDIDRKTYEIDLPIIIKAGVEHKIDFIESPALPILDKLLENPEKEGSFDFAFVDADKNNYWNYHKRLLKLIKVGGFVIYDNTLWGGTVALPEEDVAEPLRERRQFIIEFNKLVSADPRVEMSQVPLGDGITICRRIC